MRFSSRHSLLGVGLAWWVFAQAAVTTVSASPPDKLLVLAGEDSAARAGDAEALQRLTAAQGKTGWFVNISKRWFVRPPQLAAMIYLQPTSQTVRLRRGESLRAFSPDPPTEPWSLLPPGPQAHGYAQVSLPDHPFDGNPKLPGSLDGPFVVTGKIADADLVALVDYIRTSPDSIQIRALPNGPDGEHRDEISSSGTVDGTEPIGQVQCTDPGTVVVTTRRRSGAGQSITVQKVDGHWKVKSVSMWFA